MKNKSTRGEAILVMMGIGAGLFLFIIIGGIAEHSRFLELPKEQQEKILKERKIRQEKEELASKKESEIWCFNNRFKTYPVPGGKVIQERNTLFPAAPIFIPNPKENK